MELQFNQSPSFLGLNWVINFVPNLLPQLNSGEYILGSNNYYLNFLQAIQVDALSICNNGVHIQRNNLQL